MHQDDQQLRKFGNAWAGSRGNVVRCCALLCVGTGHYQVWSRLAGLKPPSAVFVGHAQQQTTMRPGLGKPVQDRRCSVAVPLVGAESTFVYNYSEMMPLACYGTATLVCDAWETYKKGCATVKGSVNVQPAISYTFKDSTVHYRI